MIRNPINMEKNDKYKMSTKPTTRHEFLQASFNITQVNHQNLKDVAWDHAWMVVSTHQTNGSWDSGHGKPQNVDIEAEKLDPKSQRLSYYWKWPLLATMFIFLAKTCQDTQVATSFVVAFSVGIEDVVGDID